MSSAGTPAARVLYIAGSGRSGSTLVERILGSVPGWVNVGELIEVFRKPNVAQELCGCGESFERCEFWSEIVRIAFGSWSSEALSSLGQLQQRISRQRFVPRLLMTGADDDSAFARRLRDFGSAYDAVYSAIAEVSAAEVIVDASKWPGQGLALRKSLQRTVSLLHIVRDPRGVAYSWAKTSVRRPQAGDSTSVMATHSPVSTARRWMAFETEIALIRPGFESRADLRYEDFTVDPRRELIRVTEELGVAFSAEDIAHVTPDAVTLPPSHGVAGNPSRFTTGVVMLRPDDEWTHRLDRRSRRTVTALTAPWLLRHGYPLRLDLAGGQAADPPADRPSVTPQQWPAVDVVIPTRGRPELVRETVTSVVDQDYPGPLMIVVVHDAEDPQHDLKSLARPGRQIALTVNTHPTGLAGARNTGLDMTVAEFVASCDDDDTWDFDKLRRQMERMLAEPDTVVLGAGIRLLMGPDRVVEWAGDSSVVTRQQLLRSRRKELHSSTLLIRRQVFDVIGQYDEKLPGSYAEDYDLLLRAVEVGRIGVINEPLASIRQYNMSWFRERGEVVAEALEYLLAKHPQIAQSRQGHARVLGQIAFARSTMGQRKTALLTAGKAFRRWPIARHAALAVVQSATGVNPQLLLGLVRRAGRGIT